MALAAILFILFGGLVAADAPLPAALTTTLVAVSGGVLGAVRSCTLAVGAGWKCAGGHSHRGLRRNRHRGSYRCARHGHGSQCVSPAVGSLLPAYCSGGRSAASSDRYRCYSATPVAVRNLGSYLPGMPHEPHLPCHFGRVAFAICGRVVQPFGFTLTDPSGRLSRTRLLLRFAQISKGPPVEDG
jgi:hypothetical protein